MNFWTPDNIRAVTAGTWVRRPDPARPVAELSGLSTDTRAIQQGQVFLALRGANFDAHDFLDRASDAGALLLIVDDRVAAQRELARRADGPAILRVRDTLRALGALGAAYRRSLESVRVIAVCGANGKTTTTRLIHSVLSTRLRGSASPKSFNNEIGVPLTIFGAKPSDQYLVCEVGTNAPGETARLARMLQPDIAVITSVGRAHIEFFGSLDAVVREDAAIFADLKPYGVAIVPAGEPLLADFLKPVPNVVTFGAESGADLRLTQVTHDALSDGRPGLKFSVNARAEFELPLLGEHNAMNALGAVAVARRFALDDDAIGAGLRAAAPADMRLVRRDVGGVDLLIDCYNANPESAAAAIRTFTAISGEARRRVLVLGDMLELGAHARECHMELAELIRQGRQAELVVTVGPQTLHIAEFLSHHWPTTKFVILSDLSDETARKLAQRLQPGDSVLLKGSRGMRLERIVHAMEALAASDSADSATARASRDAEPRTGPAPAQSLV